MSEQKYFIPCFTTGHYLAEGTANDLREYYNLCGKGDPFDSEGNLLPFEAGPSVPEQKPQAPRLTLVKS